MTSQKPHFKWINSVVSFILLLILALTGLANWFILPRGFEASRGAVFSLRHWLREIHEVAAVLFLAAVLIHLMTHWPYIKAHLKRYGFMK